MQHDAWDSKWQVPVCVGYAIPPALKHEAAPFNKRPDFAEWFIHDQHTVPASNRASFKWN